MSDKKKGKNAKGKKDSGFSIEKKESGFSTEKKESGFSTEKKGLDSQLKRKIWILN